MVMPAI